MLNRSGLSGTYLVLLQAIHSVGGVECEKHPALWYPEDEPDPTVRHQMSVIAKGICYDCPIKKQCFDYALRTNQRHGIWGGTSPEER
jgi:hypothetical protein